MSLLASIINVQIYDDMCIYRCCVWVCVISSRIAPPFWIMQVSRMKWSLLPLGSIMAAWVKVFSDTKSSALNFKWDFGEGLKRRGKSVKGFTLLTHPPPLHPSFFISFSLSPLSTFSKSIYILTPGCRGILSCCYATWMSSRMSECEYTKTKWSFCWLESKKGEKPQQHKKHQGTQKIKSIWLQ